MANMLDKLLDWLFGAREEKLLRELARRQRIRENMEAIWDAQGRRWGRDGNEVSE